MPPLITAAFTAAGGVLAGLACAAVALHVQSEQLFDARRKAAAARRRAAHAEYLALHDDTTGIGNRRALLGALDVALAGGGPTGVVLLDLDDFKSVNDTYGHEHGNEVLTTVGRRLTDLPPPVHVAARLSGDEFALLVCGDPEQTRAGAHAAAAAVSGRPIPVAGTHSIAVHASVGHAQAGPDTTARDLLHRADLAMYEAKRHRVTDPASPHLSPRSRCRDARHPQRPDPAVNRSRDG